MQNAINYYKKQFNLGSLSKEERDQFIKTHGLQNMSIADQEQYYKNNQFTNYFNSDPNYSKLKTLDYRQRNELLDNAIINKTVNTFFNKDNTSEDNLIRINQLTTEGKKDLLNSDYDPSDKYYNQNPLETIALGATMGAGVGAWFGAIGAVPGAIAGAAYGGLASIGDALVSSLYNNNTESKLNDIVAKDNDRKKEQAQKIAPQVSNLLGSITNGDIFKDANAMQQAAPVLQELKAYGVDVSKGEASNLDALFNKVVAKNNSYYNVFKDRHELSDLTNGDKMNMIVQTLATDLTFNDGGYSSMSINNQDLQNHISKNQSAGDWGFNTAKNVVVGTVGALGETVAGLAAAGAYGYDKVNNALGGNSHLANDIIEGNNIPLLFNLAYWDGVDKFNTFDSDIIKKARENGGISPYNNVSLAGEEGRFFSWESLNEATKMGKYALANRITGGTLGQASKLAKNTVQYTASKLGMEATKALNLGNNVGKWSAMGTYMTAGVPVAAGYGLGAYEDTKQKLTEKEDTRQAKELLKSYLNTKEYNNKVEERVKELMQPRIVEGRNTNLTSKETATMMAKDQIGREMAAYFTDYVKNNRDEVASSNKDFKDNRDNIERIATDAFALDATIEAAKNTFININYRNYLFGKQTNQLLKGEQNGIKPYNPRMVKQRYNPLTKKMETVPNSERGNLFYNTETKKMEYQEAPKKAGWTAVKDAIWGGFISNYTDDLTTGAVEGAAVQRYDNYLDQKYNKNAIASVGKFLENLYSTSNAFIQGGVEKMTDKQSFYDGFVGALGAAVPGSGRLFGTSPYEGANSRNFRSKGSKFLERALSTTGIGNAYYDAKYQNIANNETVSQINKVLSDRSLDLNDILDLASITNLAESSVENGTLSDAKTAKDKAFLSTLLFLNREKNNPIVQAHPAIQNALKAINAIREGTLGTDKANEETKALYENMKQDFLKESSNKEEAKLPQEEAEAAAEERLQHNINKAKTIIDSMDETMARLQIDHPNISQEALDFVTTMKVMADTYDARINEMENSLGLTEGSTISHKQDMNDILALFPNKKLQVNRLKEIQYNKDHLSNRIEQLNEYLSDKDTRELYGGKSLLKALIEALKKHMDNLSIEESLIEEASTHLDEDGKYSKVFTEQEIENMDADSRAYLFSNKNKLSSEQKKVLDNLEQKYLEKGIFNVEEYMDDLAKLKNSREGNIKAFIDSSKNPDIAQQLVYKKQNEFLKNILDTGVELRGDALEEELISINPNILVGNNVEQSDYQAILPVLYKYDNITLDKILSRHDNEALTNIINRVKKVNNFKSKILPAITDTPELSQSVDNILMNSLRNNNSIDAEFEKVFNSSAVDDATKNALKKAYNKAKGIESTEKSTVIETKEEKKARQESQETQAKQEEKKVQDAEDKVKSHVRKLYDKYLQQLNKANTPIEKLTAINSLLQTNEKASKLGKELLQKEELDKIQKIQETLKEEGYEITPLLGTQYDDGMKVIAEFVPRELGQKNNEIVSVSTPQILKDGKLVQTAKIVVATQVIEQAPEVDNRTLRSSFKEVGLESNESAAGRIQNDNGGNLTSIQAKIIRTKALTVFENAQDSDNQRLHDAIVSAAHGIIANASVLALLYKALDAVKKGRMSVREAMALLETYMDIDDDTHKSLIANLDKTIEEIEQSLQRKSQSQKEKNIQETYQETEREKSNEKNAQETYTETEQERKNQEEANKQLNTYEQTDEDIARDKAIEEQRKEGVDFSSGTIDFESPDWEKQVEQAEAEGHKIEEGIVAKGAADTTDQGNNFTSTSENMLGNAMYGYDVKALEEDAKEVERTGEDPNDKMSRFFNWFKTANIKLQEIIDNELKDIVKANNKLEMLYVNPQANATDDAALNDFSLLCVEYTDAVKRVHNDDRGGVITANGKQYLIVGTMGFDRTNQAQGNTYRSVLYQGKKNRYKYFTENPSERFFVDPSGHTEVEQMTSGRIVREMVGDTETKVRPVTELLSDPNRNPKGLKLQDLKWGIMFEDGLHYANVSSRNTVYPPRDTLSNLGAVFLLIEAANGNYIPAAIRPTMLSDIQDGTLKIQLNNLFNELSSVKYSDRLSAINQLVKLLNIKEDGDNILVGMKDKATVSTVKNGTVIRTFNLNDANFNRMDLINAIFELNPRINITLSTLSDPVQLRMYAEAGALNTDIAKLGTSNASYTVYSMDANGNPIKTKPIENGTPNLYANSDLDKADYKKKHSIYHRGIQYREKNEKWYDTNWKEITDPTLLNQIKWASYIRANDLTPNLISNDIYGNKNNKYYIINSDNTNAKVIKVFENGAIAELSIADSRTVINIVQQRDIQTAREKAAKEERQRLENIENSMTPDKVEMTAEGEDVNLTDEQITAQESGDFSSEAKPQPTDTELRAQAIVDRITTDTHDIILDNKKSVYIDSTGKEYARVTSVIQATEGTERFDPNSPWILPSTNIGTGIDNFVRDFFANKLGNLDSLHERYPNSSTNQLQAFEKQLRELKTNFDKKGLIVIPRDVTVTGEVEVTDANGKKYKLSVAGTLDLLAYDRDGNFYIFDMKTNHSVPNAKKAAKWNKQLSLYKQFLEEKYGVSVKGTSIIPIEVSYPTPKGWRDGKTIYRADEKTNQLYYQTDYGTNTLAPETAFMDSNPTLHANIPIITSPVKIEYSLLTDSERALLSPVMDGTFNSSTGTTNIESKNKNKDINKTGNISLAELQASANSQPTDVSSILKNRNYSKKVREVLKEKGFKGKISEVEAWLKEHNMPISNIEDINSWIDMLQNCR